MNNYEQNNYIHVVCMNNYEQSINTNFLISLIMPCYLYKSFLNIVD